MNQLGRALTEYADPPVKVLFVYNSNAAVTSPDQRRILKGLERDDLFTVVFDQVMTDTARYADVLLPATTFLEGYDLARGYGPISLRLGKPVDRAGRRIAAERRRLRRAARPPRRCRTPTNPHGELEEMLDVLAQLPAAIGDELREDGAATPPFGGRPIQFLRRLAADAGPQGGSRSRAHSTRRRPPGLYGYQPDPATPEFPLALISPASERTISSTLAELPRPEVGC